MFNGAAFIFSAGFPTVMAGTSSSSGSKSGKLDLSKLEKTEALTNFDITIKDDNKVKLSTLKVKGGNTNFDCDKDAFKKDGYSVTLALNDNQETKENEGEVICVCKISTDNDGKDLKLEAVSSFDKLDAGSYVIFTVADSKKSIKIDKKVFEKKQKLENKKTYKDDDEK